MSRILPATWTIILPEPVFQHWRATCNSGSYRHSRLPRVVHDGTVCSVMCRHTKVALFSAVLLNALPALLGAAQDGQATVVAQEEVHINLDRIRQRLEALPVEGVDSFLRLEYRLSVYAKAPEINPLEGFDTRNGEVPYGLPTHRDLQNSWTPEGFSTPAIPLTPLLRWTWR